MEFEYDDKIIKTTHSRTGESVEITIGPYTGNFLVRKIKEFPLLNHFAILLGTGIDTKRNKPCAYLISITNGDVFLNCSKEKKKIITNYCVDTYDEFLNGAQTCDVTEISFNTSIPDKLKYIKLALAQNSPYQLFSNNCYLMCKNMHSHANCNYVDTSLVHASVLLLFACTFVLLS